MAVSDRKETLTLSILQGSDEDVPMCSPCEHGRRLAEAHGFCRDCNEHLCEPCYNSHLRPRLFRNHVLLDKASMPRVAPTPDDMCPKHTDQQLEYYCGNHDKLECSKCVHIYHRTCKDVSYIPDICQDIEDTNEFKTLYRSLTGIEQAVVQRKTTAETDIVDVRTKITETKVIIHDYRKYLEQQLDKMEEAACGEVDVHGESNIKALEDVSDECDRITSSVRSVLHKMNIDQKSQQKMRLFITMKQNERIVADWQNNVHELTSKSMVQQFEFKPEKQLQDVISSSQRLGRLVIEDDTHLASDAAMARNTEDKDDSKKAGITTKSKAPAPSSRSQPKSGISTNILPKPLAESSASKIDKINVQTPSDSKTCYISGSVVTCYNYLAVSDYNNSSLKIINLSQKKVTKQLVLKHSPWDIAQVNEHTLAITCPLGGYIQIVTVSSSGAVALGTAIPVGGDCRGIRCIDSRGVKLVVSFSGPDTVKIIDLSGQVLKNLSAAGQIHSKFSMPFHIAVSNNGRGLLVSNAGSYTVQWLTLDGKMDYAYKDGTLVHPRGLAVGHRGEVFVCNHRSHQIQVMYKGGRNFEVLFQAGDDVHLPESITYSENKLFVGSENNNYVDVYQVKHLQCHINSEQIE